MKMKLNRKKIIMITAAVILLGLGIAVPLLCRSSATVKVAFYKIPQEQEELIKSLIIDSQTADEKIQIKFLEDDDTKDIVTHSKKADILFTKMGLAADRSVESIPKKKIRNTLFDSSIIAGTSISAAEFALNTAGSKDGKVSQIPLFFDGYEMLISIQALGETKTEAITSWTDIETFASKAKSAASGIAFAAGDADTLLGVISVVTEAFDGKEKYNSVIEKIRAYDGPMPNLFETLLQEDDAFHDTMERILSWKKKGIFNTELLKISKEDFFTIVERYRTAIIIMPLSDHRKLSMSTAKYMTTLPIHSNETNFYFPSMRPLNTRSAMTSAVAMIPMTTSSNAKDAVKFLLGTDAQENIAFRTGLAPFLANCKIPDMQSDDLRFWIAATSEPSIPMEHAAFDDEKKKEEFAQAVRDYIIKN